MDSETPDSIHAALEDAIRVGLDIYGPDAAPTRSPAAQPEDAPARIAAALLETPPGAELLSGARTVGLSMSSISFELPPELLAQITEEVLRQVRAELRAGATSESEFLDTKEAAAFLRSSTQRVYDLVSKRHLRPHKDGSRNLFRRSDLENYLRGSQAGRG